VGPFRGLLRGAWAPPAPSLNRHGARLRGAPLAWQLGRRDLPKALPGCHPQAAPGRGAAKSVRPRIGARGQGRLPTCRAPVSAGCQAGPGPSPRGGCLAARRVGDALASAASPLANRRRVAVLVDAPGGRHYPAHPRRRRRACRRVGGLPSAEAQDGGRQRPHRPPHAPIRA